MHFIHKATAARFALLMFWSMAVAHTAAQTLEDRVRALEQQNEKLVRQNGLIQQQNSQILSRLQNAEALNRDLEARLAATETHSSGRLEVLVDSLGDIIADLGPTTGGQVVTDYRLTRSGSPLQFYGRIRLDSYYNTARFNRTIDPQWLRPEDDINAPDNREAFAFDARLSTIGANVDGGRVGDARVRGKIEVDFANFTAGRSESRAEVRLLLAYIDIELGNFSLRFGQDWDIVSPYDPLVDEHRHLWDTGNLGDRRPMAQLHYRGGSAGGVEYEFGVALGLTGAVDNLDLDGGFGSFLSTERDGFESGHPHVQVSASITFDGWVPGDRITFGLSGAWGSLDTDTEFDGQDDFTIWLVAFDLYLPLFDRVHLKAEGFWGEALSDFRGGISQSVNVTTGDEIESMGGWAEIFWQATDLFGIGVGGSIDNPEFDDLDLGMRASNWTIYVATRFNWGGGLVTGLDAMFWKTQYADRDEGDGLRFNAFVEFHF